MALNNIDKYIYNRCYDYNRLPGNYMPVEYIESSGTQYIDTNISAKSGISWEIIFSLINLNSNCWIGARNGYIKFWCMLFNSRFNPGLNDDHVTGITPVINTKYKHNLITDSTGWKAYFNDELAISGNDVLSAITLDNISIYLFRANSKNGGNPYSGSTKIYYTKIWDNTNLICNFIPCYRISDNKPGMYDILNNNFHTNQGSGEFIAGPDLYPVNII